MPSDTHGDHQPHKCPRTFQDLEDPRTPSWVRVRSPSVTHPWAPRGETHRHVRSDVRTPKRIRPATDTAGSGHAQQVGVHTGATAQTQTHTQIQLHLNTTSHKPISKPSSSNPHKEQLFPPKNRPQAKQQRPPPLEKQGPSPTPARPRAPLPHALGVPCPRPPTACRRRWARSAATSRARAAGSGPAHCGPRTCPGPSRSAAGCGWGAGADATSASGVWLCLGGCERDSARWMPPPLLGPLGSPCARRRRQGEQGAERAGHGSPENEEYLRPPGSGQDRGWRRQRAAVRAGGAEAGEGRNRDSRWG